MKVLVIVVLTLATVITGVAAALFSLQSTRVPVVPGWDGISTIEPVDPAQANAGWTVGLLNANNKSSDLNRKAAWSALAAAVLGALTGFAALWWP
ncbi:hypothetical protein [Paraburkholderia sediminicola]|uniref:hypothetical protein n=1 Tax=Paraburkholderia sediminicola TaxID=458836 RepID=UPI0038BD3779